VQNCHRRCGYPRWAGTSHRQGPVDLHDHEIVNKMSSAFRFCHQNRSGFLCP
jgi:hypothetical protein